MTDEKGSADDGRWSAGEALGFIAFGCPVFNADWGSIPGHGPSQDWRRKSAELLAAFDARAERKPWRPTEALRLPARTYRADVRRLMRETGQTPAALANDLRRDLARDEECGSRLKQAQDRLRAALAIGHLVAEGQKTRDIGEPPLSDALEEIPARHFAGPSALTVQLNGWTFPPLLGRPYVGPWWQGVTFKEKDVRGAFPTGTTEPEKAAMGGAAEPPAIYHTGAQGRPSSKHLVIQEFNRRSANGGVPETLVATARLLKAWLREKHPAAAPMTTNTIETSIRLEYRAYKRSIKTPR